MTERKHSTTETTPATLSEGPPTMSSREIADLCETRHNQVVETIERLFEKGVLRESRKTTRPYNPPGGGRPTDVYDLTKRDSLVVVAGYDDAVRAKIIDRWMELETRDSDPQPAVLRALSDPAAMRGILLGYTEKVMELEVKLQLMGPKVEAHDRIAESHGTFCRSTAAKMLNVPPHTLTRWMRTNGWTFRRPGDRDDIAYQSKIANGYLEHKITTGPRPDGTEWSSTQVRVTPKGLAALAKAFPPAAAAA